MTLSAGSRLAQYEILAAIGAGGMGEVYRARDTQLNRDVAIKALPDAFAADPDRVMRRHVASLSGAGARDPLPAEPRRLDAPHRARRARRRCLAHRVA